MVRVLMVLAAAAALLMAAGPEAVAGQPVAGKAVAEPPTVEALVLEALEQSAELRALEERIRAAEASVAPAGALPHPMGSVAISNVPVGGLELDRTPMSGVELGVSQGVPAAEKRRLRREVKREEVDALRACYDDRRDDLVRRVRQGYTDLQYLDGALVIAEENKDLAGDFVATAEARYATGKGLQQDVFRAQVRLSRMMDTLISLRQRRAAAATRLNRLLYRPGEDAVPTLPGLTRSLVDLAGESLGARAEAGNPRLREARIRWQQAGTRERLASAGIRPDFTLGFRYRLRESVPMDPTRGSDFW
jgi:cobalt-zinc-cadmium efflux system outer membrane protein